MIKKKITTIFFMCAIILFSCAGKNNSVYIIPPAEYFNQEKKTIDIDSITETKDGLPAENLPVWLLAFIKGGIEEVERIDTLYGKYAFVGINEGVNFNAMKLWADNFSVTHDFTMLAAERIKNRMISKSALYPDDEYGFFFETMVKKAYSTVYNGAVKEDTYWIKIKKSEESEIYNFFVLIDINKPLMQAIISNMLAEVNDAVVPSDSQSIAIINLRQTFFEGF